MNVFKMSKSSLLKKVMMLLVVLVTTAMFIKVNAETSYPFRTGEDAFKNSPTWYGDPTNATGDTWQYLESRFDAVDLSDTSKDYYIAVEIKATQGNPGFTFGLVNGGNRYATYIEGAKLYTVTAAGAVTEISVQYSSINIGAGFEGMLVAPLSSLAWISWAGADKTLASITGVYIETNAMYNWGFALTIGEIGLYTGDFRNGGQFTLLKDLKNDLKQNTYHNGRPQNELVFPELQLEAANPYPFRAGENAFKNAPTWYGDATVATVDTYQYLESHFAELNLSAAKEYYVAVEIKVAKGNPGFTIGLQNYGNRYATYIDGQPLYTVDAAGNIKTINVLYASINLGEGFEGMLVMPLSSLAWVSWAGENKSLSQINGIFIETNAKYNFDFALTIGEIGFYEGNFERGGKFTLVKDLSEDPQKGAYYNARPAQNPLEWPAEPKPSIIGVEVEYPFATGENAFSNAVIWNGVAKAPNMGNWQTLNIAIDKADLSQATYIAVQYSAKAGAPGITYGLEHGGARYSLAGKADGEIIYFVEADGIVKKGAEVLYSASNIYYTGMLLIPMDAMAWQFGDEADRDLTEIERIILTTDSYYNYNYDIIVGEIGYYTGEAGTADFQFHKLLDTTNGHQRDHFTCTSVDPAYVGKVGVNKVDRTTYGDAELQVFGTNKSGSDYAIWDGGSYGKVEMGVDSYGDDAIVMTSTGANPTGDSYTAITLADGIAYDWSDGKGVTLWVRNDSEGEISFNIQLDCLVDVDGDGVKDRGRFNVRQGYQFWLYDINTGKDTIYMTRPEVTIPKGFEGWVRVPFGAFHQADWSLVDPGHKVIPRNYFMAEGSVVGYLAVTIHAPSYQGMTFAVNKLGYYKTTPILATAIMTDDSKSIKKLMGLE